MNGVHDLGGMHGFGPIVREADEPFFDANSAVRIRLLMSLVIERGLFNIDAFRHGIERMPPADYLRGSYFARWLTSVSTNLIEAGIVTADEIEARVNLLRRQPDALTPLWNDERPLLRVRQPRTKDAASPPAPRFVLGDAVVTRNVHPT